MAAKKENDLIQAAVAARLAGKNVDADNVAQVIESGKRLEVEARVQGADGQPWFRLLSGLYIVDDPTVTSYGEV